MEFVFLVFTGLPGESYRRQLMSLLLCLCEVFQVLINSLVCWFCAGALGLVLFQIETVAHTFVHEFSSLSFRSITGEKVMQQSIVGMRLGGLWKRLKPFTANTYVFLVQFSSKTSPKKQQSRPKLLLLRAVLDIWICEQLELKQEVIWCPISRWKALCRRLHKMTSWGQRMG